jgi:hypothetical protein
MQWELTEKKYLEKKWPYDLMPDHRDRVEFQKRCYNQFTQQPYGPVREAVKHFVRVTFQGKEYLYTNRERTGKLANGKTDYTIWIPEWDIWLEPVWDTIDEIDDKRMGSPIEKVVGVKGWITHYLHEWDTTKFDELMKIIDWDTKFFVKKHGIVDPAIQVPNAEIFRANSWGYLYMQKFMNDPKYADIAELARYEAAIAAGINNPQVGNAPTNSVITPQANIPGQEVSTAETGKLKGSKKS